MRQEIVVYGVGSFFNRYREKVNEDYITIGYYDKSGNAPNLNVIDDISLIPKDIPILIMIENIRYIFEVIKDLTNIGVDEKNLILGISKYGQYSHLSNIYVDDCAKLHIVNKDIDLIITTEDEFYNAVDTILFECYKYWHHSDNKEIVIDVGMNIADAAIYFARKTNVEKVYAFEPFYYTYKNGIKNVELNCLEKKIKIYNYGLSDTNETRQIEYCADMSCAQSTIQSNVIIANNHFSEQSMRSKKILEKVEVRKSSEIISSIINDNRCRDYIMKIDCEGEEYRIIEDLAKERVLESISLIMLEWHYKSDKALVDTLCGCGFDYFSMRKSILPDLGLIFAINSKKE